MQTTKLLKIQSHVLKEFKIDAIRNDYKIKEKIKILINEYQKGARTPEYILQNEKSASTTFQIDEDDYNIFRILIAKRNQKIMQSIEGLIVSYLKEKGINL